MKRNLGQTIGHYIDTGECDADARQLARERMGDDDALKVVLRRWYMGTQEFSTAVNDVMAGDRTIVDAQYYVVVKRHDGTHTTVTGAFNTEREAKRAESEALHDLPLSDWYAEIEKVES